MLNPLNLPEYKHKIITENDKQYILDPVRNKYLLLTPEEWVRQNFLKYLIAEKKYPAGLISIEAGIKMNHLKRRYDALLYSRQGKPFMLLEFKSPSVRITQKVFDQITEYNNQFVTPYIIVSNGLKHYCCKLNDDNQKYEFLPEIPDFDKL
jgi:hypothetical protein